MTILTIAEASRLIRERKLSPVELTQACLARIGRGGELDPQTVRRDGWTVRGWPVGDEGGAASEEPAGRRASCPCGLPTSPGSPPGSRLEVLGAAA